MDNIDTDQARREWIDAIEIEVVRSFVASGVRFLVTGGRAVQFHGHARPAKDLDLLVEVSDANWMKLAGALRPLGARRCRVLTNPLQENAIKPPSTFIRRSNF